jgi:hypothetical protein
MDDDGFTRYLLLPSHLTHCLFSPQHLVACQATPAGTLLFEGAFIRIFA